MKYAFTSITFIIIFIYFIYLFYILFINFYLNKFKDSNNKILLKFLFTNLV